ncbi:MAG: ADP-ribosylglycohydrolase family protein [Bacteroidota bacterium]
MKILRLLFLLTSISIFNWNCERTTELPTTEKETIKDKIDPFQPIRLSKEALFDKVLGMLVGSALGDAMGAPTEMWQRYNIRTEYGFVSQLDDMTRAPSPEGTWQMNLSAGGTTDDTRWKALLTDFVLQEGNHFYQQGGSNPYHFAEFVVARYQEKIEDLRAVNSFHPAPYEEALMKMSWLQEWAIVAKPFAEKDLEGYARALSQFYGGETTCAGMLYAPMIGLMHPNDPATAYQSAYRLGIFDLGYARDITGLTAAMTATALKKDVSPNDILNTLRNIDPNGFFKSRLVGRSAHRFYQSARYAVTEAKKITKSDIDFNKLKLPYQGQDTLYFAQMQYLFDFLDGQNQDMAFHPGEIHQINLTALLFTNFDFEKSLAFVTNYGRDNDTVGAITGAILGAMYGFDALPSASVEQVLAVNKSQLGIDLEKMAEQLTTFLITQGKVNVM